MKVQTRLASLLFAVLLLLAPAVPAGAQSLTGQLSGTVVDSSDAVLPGVTVTLVNELSGDQRTTVSNDSGNFVFAAVQASTYTVKAELSGFQTIETRGIVLRLGESRNLTQLKLGVAGLTEQVAVTAITELAPISSGEKSVSITGEQIQNIAIVGRSAAELLKILPGMAPSGGGSSGAPTFNGEIIGINGNGDGGKQSALGNYSSNGTGSNALDIVIDGAHASDPGCNCATSVNPNPDMVEEFKVLQANFGAENAKGPTTINVVSKSGGRDFRGTAYIYARNYKLNSNEWFLNKVGSPKPENKFYFPGFNLGGPLLIPGTDFNKGRDKLFFFFGYEYYKQDLDTGTLRSWVPTQAMRNGDFSDLAYLSQLSGGSVNKQPSFGPTIPSNLIDPNGQILVNLLPLPNVNPAQANGYNYVQNVPLTQNNHQALGRVDVSVSDNTKLFFRYNFQAEKQPFPVGLWWRNGAQVPYPTPVVADNRSHSATASLTKVFGSTLTSETTFGLTYINFPNRFEDPSKVSRSALGYTNPGIYRNGLDQIPSIAIWGDGPTMFNPGGFDPELFAKKWLISLSQSVTKVAGAHTFKAGGYYEFVTNNQPGNGNSNGVLDTGSWAGGSTGNGIADLLTGQLNSYGESTKNVLHNMGSHIGEFYVQDSWKVKPRVTLEGGLRVSHLGNWYDREGIGMGVFDSSLYNPNAPLSALSGLTYHALDSSIPLSGAKSKYLFFAPRVGFAWDLQGTGQTVLRGGYGIFNYHDEQGPFAGSIDVPAGFRSTTICCNIKLADVPNITPQLARTGITALDRNDDEQPRTQSWSLTMQRRLPWSVTLETGYVGSKSDRLRNDGLANINIVPFGAMFNTGSTNADDFRPFKSWNNIDLVQHNLYSNYHSWQSLVSRQTGKVSFTAAYTYSKALGIRGGGGRTGRQINPPDLNRLDEFSYGTLGSDRRHLLSFAYSWLLPEVKTGLTNAVLGNWQISGISQFVSGVPLQLVGGDGNFRVDGTNAQGVELNSINIVGSPDIQVMPVLTCDPRGSGDTIANAECFTAPAVGDVGTYVWPNITGSWYTNHDLSVFKNFPFGDNKKFQFRLSAYNVFNHPQRALDDNQNLNLSFANGAQTNANFGILPTDNKYGRRIIQLAFKFYF